MISVTVTCLLLLFSTLNCNGTPVAPVPGSTQGEPKNDTTTTTVAGSTGGKVNTSSENSTTAAPAPVSTKEEQKNGKTTATVVGSTGGEVNTNSEKSTTAAPAPVSTKEEQKNVKTTVTFVGSNGGKVNTNSENTASSVYDDEYNSYDIADDEPAAEADVDEDQESEDKLNYSYNAGDETADAKAEREKDVSAAIVETPKSTQFLPYFIAAVVAFVVLYLAYHQRNKIMAFVIEGKRSLAKRKREPRPKAGEYTKITTSAEDVDTRTKGFAF